MARRRAVRRTLRPAVTLALLAPLTLTGCAGNGGEDASGRVTSLRAMDYYSNQPDKGIYRKALTACGRRAGVRIEREVVPNTSYMPRVLQQAASRTLPDVLMLDNPELRQIAAVGALAPISDFGLSARGYAPGVVSAASYKGKVYGLQPVANTIGLFYNKKMLDKAGIRPPSTWAELRSAAKRLRSGHRYGIAFSAPATYEGTWQFLPFMWSNGGDERDIATPQVRQALQLWTDMVSDGAASKSVVNWGQADVMEQFKAGKSAMMINGPWQFPVLDEEKDLDYGVVPIPAPRAGNSRVAPLGGETWAIPQTGDRRRQTKAAQVIECLNSDANQLSLARQRQTVPTKTALTDESTADQPRMKAFSEQVKGARARTGRLGAGWPKAADKIFTALQTALTGEATPGQALRQAQHG